MYIGVRSSGAYTQLNVGSIVYLGGLPRLSSLNPAAVKDVTSQRDFQGTISHFIVCIILSLYLYFSMLILDIWGNILKGCHVRHANKRDPNR